MNDIEIKIFIEIEKVKYRLKEYKDSKKNHECRKCPLYNFPEYRPAHIICTEMTNHLRKKMFFEEVKS